jgi:beta-lactamase regulating signal transducer with metallopeptidase domain
MFSSDALYPWLVHSALVSLVVLSLGGGAVLLWRQPARRVRIIELTLAGCLVVPWLGMVPGYPQLAVVRWDAAILDRHESLPPSAEHAITPAVMHGKTPPRTAGDLVVRPTEHIATAPNRAMDIASSMIAFYLLGAAMVALWWLAGITALARVLWSARPASPRCRQLLTQIAGQRSARVRLLVSRAVSQPLAFAWRRAVIVLPENLGDDEQAVRWALAHEWAHVEHHDFRAWFVAGFARLLFFYNPLVWWFRRQLRLCQDFLADAQASRQASQPEDYAEFLTVRAAAGSLRPAMAALGMGFRKSELYRRIIMLVQNEPLESRIPRLWNVSATCAALVLVAAVAALSWSRPLAAETQPNASGQESADQKVTQPTPPSDEKLAMMGQVEDFFLHNFRDVSARKSLEWGDVKTGADGSRSIRYMYEANIWGSKVLVMNQIFTFDKQDKFVRYKNVAGFPKPKTDKKPDVSTKEGMKALVEDFFHHNWRDITAHKTIEWGEVTKLPNGNRSIRYKFLATIWYSDTKTMNRIFTFDPQGKFVSVENVKQPAAGDTAAAPPARVYQVNKKVSEFPDREDLSTPEAAYASIHRAFAAEGEAAFSRLSAPKLAEHMPHPAKKPLAKIVAEPFLDAEILEVHLWGDTHAVVIARMTNVKQTREYMDLRSLIRVKGRWLNIGNDARDTLEQARQSIAQNQTD